MIRLLLWLFPSTKKKVREEMRRDNAALVRVLDDVLRNYK